MNNLLTGIEQRATKLLDIILLENLDIDKEKHKQSIYHFFQGND